MKKSWPKVFRDPVHGIIHFEDNPCDKLLLNLIETPEFQRLRRIKHLGLCDLVFPGATHSRFAHALGTMHIIRKMLAQISKLDTSLAQEQKTAVCVAALLHDIGHGPFSHAYEKITKDKHEKRTLEIILDHSTEINAKLRKHSPRLPDQLAIFFSESVDEGKRPSSPIPAQLTQLLSSQLDADRFDYLLRDSHATGTDYGRFDLEWLLLQFKYHPEKKRFYLSRKALSAVEDYVYARYHMYRSVYFHKATRAAEVMLRLIFRRYKELLDAAPGAKKKLIVPEASPVIFQAFSQSSTSLATFLTLDDFTVNEFFKACAKTEDTILQALGRGLITRNLYKGVDASDASSIRVGEFTKKAAEVVASHQLNPDYALEADSAEDTPYKTYDPDAEKPAALIYFETINGGFEEVSTISDSIGQLKKKYSLLRYYYLADIRVKIEKIAESTLGKKD